MASSPSSLREIPTVTVLAWCLMASMGRVNSSIPRVSAAVRSSISTSGVPTLPYSSWYVSSGTGPVAYRSNELSRTAVLASKLPSYMPLRSVSAKRWAIGPMASRTRARASSPLTACCTACSTASRASRRGRASPSIASAASYPNRCPTTAESRNASRGSTGGTVMTSRAAPNRSSPSLAITTGAALWAR